MIYPFLASGSTRIGSICPPHAFALSPGFTSTWSDHRQNGQWFRDVYPSASTSRPQCAQVNPLSFFVNRFICKTLGLCPKPQDLGTLSQTLLRKLLEKFSKNFQNFNQGDFYPYVYAVLTFCSRLCATHSGCSETNSVNGIGTTVVSLRYRIETVEKDLGTLSQTLLKNFLKEVS